MEYILMFIGILILIFAFIFFSKFFKSKNTIEDDFKTQKDESGNVVFVRCPICETPLTKKDNLHSRIFRPMTTPDQRMTVQGCPNCYPYPKTNVIRKCPVCKKNMSTEDELIARLFNRTENKKHVMIMGCTICMNPYKKK